MQHQSRRERQISAVSRVSQDRHPALGQMHADLMSAPRMGLALHPEPPRKPLQHSETRVSEIPSRANLGENRLLAGALGLTRDSSSLRTRLGNLGRLAALR